MVSNGNRHLQVVRNGIPKRPALESLNSGRVSSFFAGGGFEKKWKTTRFRMALK